MSTLANVKKSEGGHWYHQNGEPAYTVIAKGTGQPRPTTLADARKLNLLPSVTTILRILHRQGLVDWLCEQACLAVLTTPRNEGEALDAFVERVLHTEKIQDQESQKARDRGTELHAAMEDYFQGKTLSPEIEPWVAPAIKALKPYGELVATERILVGDGYAGKTDLILKGAQCWWVFDYKTSKKLPTGDAWPEHQLQLAAYAKAWLALVEAAGAGYPPVGCSAHARTVNVYISTAERGAFRICENQNWEQVYEQGFAPLVQYWQWANQYWPETKPAETQRRD